MSRTALLLLLSAVLLTPCTRDVQASSPSADPVPGCPTGALLAQPPSLGGEKWDAYVSDTGVHFTRYESLPGSSGSLCALRWWGFNLRDSGAGFTECAENPMSFVITIYDDAQSQPGTAVCSRAVTATGVPVAIVNSWQLYQYEAILDSCCVVAGGWISVVGGGGDASCWFLWSSSPVGDDSACQRNPQGLVCGTGLHYRDLSLCLMDTQTPAGRSTWGGLKSLYHRR